MSPPAPIVRDGYECSLQKRAWNVTKIKDLLGRSALSSGVALGIVTAVGPAYAQTPVEGTPTAATDEAAPDDIIVTGTRIPQPNLESAAPITVVSSQDIKQQGTTRIEDLLNSLPSVFASQSSSLANGADGTASVDLRGLGTTRTLSLVNGRRITPGDPSPTSGSAADINMIPSAILKRVEVLTGGASSTYGADAVSGVVNFIVDTDFTGVRIDGQYSLYQHNNRNKFLPPLLDARAATGAPGFSYPTGNTTDGGTIDATISIGSSFDEGRGHAVAYFGYRKVKAVTQARRDYSACVLQNGGSGAPRCGGSATSDNGNVVLWDTGVTTATSTIYTFTPNGGFENTASLYNFAPTNYYQRPDERYTAGVFANYEISDAVKPYMEFMFMDDRTVAQIAPSGDFGNTLTINSDNPLLSQAQRDVVFDSDNLINGFLGNFPLAAGATYNPNPGAPPLVLIDPVTGNPYNLGYFQLLRRNVEGGPRQSDLQHTSYRGVIGVKGDLSDVWSYDASYQYGRVKYTQIYLNEFSARKLALALDVVTSPTTGLPVCRTTLMAGGDPNCVPYNVFGGAGAASPASVAYLSETGFQSGTTTEQIANASVTGDLAQYGFKTPWASDGVGVNIGAEYRKETLDLQTDEAFSTGDLTGQGGATLPISGSFRVYEFFAETQIPLIQDSFIYSLSANAGYRYSSYKTSAGRSYNTDTYKLALDFAPIRDIRFRGSYNRAVRAPNIQELFATPTVGLNGASDPCATGEGTSATDYGCLAQGLSVGQGVAGNPAGQYNGLIGGNPDLKPEKATTKTFGVVIQPSFLPRLSLTVDYFDIKIADAIQPPSQDAILKDCVLNATATTTPFSCSLVHRDSAGSLWLTPNGFVDNIPNNLGEVRTKGIEVGAAFSQPLGGLGSLAFAFNGTYLDEYKVDNGITEAYDCAGYYGPVCSSGGTTASGALLPKWRHKARLSYTSPGGFGLSLQWRYIGKVKAETLSGFQSLSSETQFDPGIRVKAFSYFDLSGSFAVDTNVNFRFGVNNVFDKQPPLITSGNAGVDGTNLCPSGPCNGNTYPATYDALGRYLFIGATLDF